jgi:hypothetical protein
MSAVVDRIAALVLLGASAVFVVAVILLVGLMLLSALLKARRPKRRFMMWRRGPS